jgi:hypothetical protein
MKVPTYQSQAAIPRQGQGLFLTAQLNAGAMMAPGQAFSAQGQQLAKTGDQIAAWGFKKAQIGAESEAQNAAALMQVELADKSLISLQIADMSQAEPQFRRAAKLIGEKYSKTMSNSLARSAFASQALKLQTRAMIDFTKANNKRVVEAQKVTLDTVIRQEMRVASDITASPARREDAYNRSILAVVFPVDDLGPKETEERINAINENATKNTLAAYLSAPGADVLGIVAAFREGRLEDPIITAAAESLSKEQLAKIADDGLKRANRVIKLRVDQKKERENTANIYNDEMHRSIVNTDFTDPIQVLIARDNFDVLISAGYFDTPAKRAAIEGLFEDTESGGGSFPKRSSATENTEAELSELAFLDELTYQILLDNKPRVTKEFYFSQLANLETEFNESKRAAISLFSDAFKYSEYADKGKLGDPSRQAFRKASLEINRWLEDNRKASRSEIIDKATSIVDKTIDKFTEILKAQRFQLIVVAHSRLRPQDKSKIPVPTIDTYEDFKKEVEVQLAAQGGKNMRLQQLLAIMAQEVQLRAFD